MALDCAFHRGPTEAGSRCEEIIQLITRLVQAHPLSHTLETSTWANVWPASARIPALTNHRSLPIMHNSSALPSHPWGPSGGSEMSRLLQEALVSPVPRVPTAQPCQLPPPALPYAKKRQHRKGDPKRANTSASELTSDMQPYLGKQAAGLCQAQEGQRICDASQVPALSCG